MLAIADSRFQGELHDNAKAAGKLPDDHRIPDAHRRNFPQKVQDWLLPHRADLPDFPFGSEFTEIEEVLLPALERLRAFGGTWRGKAHLLRAALTGAPHPREAEAMARMEWAQGGGVSALALRGALRLTAEEVWHRVT